MTGDHVAEIQKRLASSTPGPWAIWEDLKDDGFVHVGNEEGVIPEGEIATAEDIEANPVAKCYLGLDALLIANAPADLAYLLAEVAALRGRLAAVKAVVDSWDKEAQACYAVGMSYAAYALTMATTQARAALATGEGEDK